MQFLLAGYLSEVVFNIMVRAIQFWDYQTNVKVMQYKYKIENMKSFLSEKDRYIENLTLKIKQHIKKEQEKINCKYIFRVGNFPLKHKFTIRNLKKKMK